MRIDAPPSKVLVTGATGFVGRHLVRELLSAGHEVHALVRDAGVPMDRDVRRHSVPHDTAGLVDLLRSITPAAVVHLAALFRGVHTVDDVEPLVRANVLLTAQIAEAASRAGTDVLIYAGTAWQHYDSREFSPVALYAATKQAGQDVLQFYAEVGGLTVVTLKLFDTYGPGDERRKLLSLIADAALSGRAVELSPGEQLIDLLHVQDVVAGLMHALEIGAVEPGWHDYSLRSGRALSIRQLVELVERVMGRALPVRFDARPYRAREMFDPWIARPPLPGWSPQIELEVGLRQILVDK